METVCKILVRLETSREKWNRSWKQMDKIVEELHNREVSSDSRAPRVRRRRRIDPTTVTGRVRHILRAVHKFGYSGSELTVCGRKRRERQNEETNAEGIEQTAQRIQPKKIGRVTDLLDSTLGNMTSKENCDIPTLERDPSFINFTDSAYWTMAFGPQLTTTNHADFPGNPGSVNDAPRPPQIPRVPTGAASTSWVLSFGKHSQTHKTKQIMVLRPVLLVHPPQHLECVTAGEILGEEADDSDLSRNGVRGRFAAQR
ncbi:hypothetical protein F2P81_010862 [Scophthalmus maximus]|uniref:Uncharacterized protein n=1 Tax=Scophthalmus maximus TaxID=52904 RepID=A0A6A4T104_SCOMX|nr:hypothetical protein F2P81_010862 [Scophthalmus maximus]